MAGVRRTQCLRRSLSGRDQVYPSNVLHLPTETGNTGHSAASPRALPEWFIKLLTESGDDVLDPFLSSGTTAIVAKELGRHYIGIEIKEEYHALACEALALAQRKLFDPRHHR